MEYNLVITGALAGAGKNTIQQECSTAQTSPRKQHKGQTSRFRFGHQVCNMLFQGSL